MAWLATLWGKIVAGGAILLAAIGVYLGWRSSVRSQAKEEARDEIQDAVRERELHDREVRDDVEGQAAGLSPSELQQRLRERWGRREHRRVRAVQADPGRRR